MGKLYFKLAKTNLSNNKPFYIPYIISSIITVAMLYMMSFLSDNKGLNKIMGADSLATIFRLGVGIIVIFSYIFVLHKQFHHQKKEKRNRCLQYSRNGKKTFIKGSFCRNYLFCNNLSGMRNYRGNSIF